MSAADNLKLACFGFMNAMVAAKNAQDLFHLSQQKVSWFQSRSKVRTAGRREF
jgi:hypothetical protein